MVLCCHFVRVEFRSQGDISAKEFRDQRWIFGVYGRDDVFERRVVFRSLPALS